jgi:hypothetical protein
MGKSSRYFSLILILIMAISSVSLFTAKPARAQTVPVPTFTMSTETSSYEIPTTYSTDPYTGANVTNLGYTLVSYNVSITIQNSPQATAYMLGVKGHDGSQWNIPWIDEYNVTAFASTGSQTVMTLYGDNNTSGQPNEIFLQYGGHWGINVPFGGLLDFRLQAVSGETPIRVLFGYEVLGNVSDWSSVQTTGGVAVIHTMSNVSPNPTQTPTSTPAVPELSWLVILPLILSVFSFAVIVGHRKTVNLKK